MKRLITLLIPIVLLGIVVCESIGVQWPGTAEYYFNRGSSHYEKGDFVEASADYTEAIRIDPGYAKAYNSRGWSKTFSSFFGGGNGFADWSKAIELEPNNPEFYHSRAVAYAGDGKHEKALVDYNKVIELATDSGKFYHHRGLTHRALGNSEKAAADFAKAKELGYEP